MENLVVKTLREKKASLQAQIEIIDNMIEEELRKQGSYSELPIDKAQGVAEAVPHKFFGGGEAVDYGSTVSQKFLGVLKKYQRFMKVREIAREIVAVYGGEEDDVVAQLSRRTKKLKEIGKIVKYQVGVSRTQVFWGSPNWLEDGEIKKDYMYNEDSLNEGRRSALSDIEL